MKKALITGGAGFIGLNLARRLLAEDVAVDLLDDFSRGRRDSDLQRLADNPRVRCLTLDLTSPGITDTLDADYDAVFHLAAILGVANVIRRPYETLKLNVDATTETLRLAMRQRDLAVFVFASTSEVYAGSLLAGLLEFPTPEDSRIALPPLEAPRTSYMLSKLYGEALVRQSGVPGVIVRPHNVYGPRMGTEHVVPELMKRMWETAPGGSLAIRSPRHSRTFCFVDDAIELLVRLAQNADSIGGVWNIGTEAPEYTMIEVAELIRSVVRPSVQLVPAADMEGSPARRCPSMTKTNAATRHHSRVSLEAGVARTFNWYRQHALS